MKIARYIPSAGLLVAPALLHAQFPAAEFPDATLFTILFNIDAILRMLVPIIAGIALLVFFWGMASFIFHAGNETARSKGRQRMFWGIIALFAIVSVWGIVEMLTIAFGTGAGGSCPPPQIEGETVTSC